VPGTTGGELWSVSCATLGSCVAGGEGIIAGHAGRAFVAAQVNGTWHPAIQVPGVAALNAGADAAVSSVSCATAGNCVVGGDYQGAGNEVFVAVQVNGIWHSAIEVPGIAALNADHETVVESVSCATAGNCAAVGSYRDGAGHLQVFVTAEVNGTWHPAIELPGTAALNSGDAEGLSVSCAAAGNCVTGGYYTDHAFHGQAFLAGQVNGTWHPAIEVPGTAALNAGGGAGVKSVSCATAGNCVVGGDYSDSAVHGHAFVVAQVNGTWHPAIEVPGVAALNARDTYVNSVSCASFGKCAAAGYYSDSAFHIQAFVTSP
jgi:hypothetical protein